jgi:hypothetical protein
MKKLEFPHELIQVAILNSLRKATFLASVHFQLIPEKMEIPIWLGFNMTRAPRMRYQAATDQNHRSDR